MDYGESALCGSGELELDPDIVSEEAGKLYSELQLVVETHGACVVESLLPILVWVLEGLASCRAQLREREEEAEKERGDREELLERYQNEKTLRRESQERYLELDDQFEQERRAMRAREKEREKRERELERKAREQADQLMALEEQKANLTRELNSIKHTHNKLVLTHRDLLEKKKEWESEAFTFRNRVHSKHSEAVSTHGQTETSSTEEHDPKAGSAPDSTASEITVTNNSKVTDAEVKRNNDQSYISDIISSTPELAHLKGFVETSSPVCSKTASELNSSLFDEMKQTQEDKREVVEDQKVEDGEKTKEEEEMDSDSDCLEWELRNTDSVFSELSELSREYVENVDQGASVRDSTGQFEQILSQYEELKHTHEMVDTARKALISRVEELTSERSALSMELDSCRETISRLEGKTKEMEDEIKRLRKDLETVQSEDPDALLPASLRRFSRSEMARVVMEKNQYKERLFELQESLRRAQLQRVIKEAHPPVEVKGSVWSRFNRFLGLTKGQLAPATALAVTVPPTPVSAQSPVGSPQQLSTKSPQKELRKRELYREIRTHVWGTLGKKQLNGWSMPLAVTNMKDSELPPEPKDVPVLIQLRLLDQRDATAKLTCAVAVPPEISGEQTCSVWAITGPASSSDVTVIDPARSNTILDQFSLPPTSPALCVCAVPPTGDTAGTVWIGTQDGSVLIHSSSGSRRRCLQSVSLFEGVHSLTYTQGEVIAGLANGTLAFFTHNSGIWNLQSQEVLSLGTPPLQPIRCCLAKEGCLWVGYWNKVYIISVKIRKVEKLFTVSERSEQQVRFLCAAGSGVWAACRLDPILRLFDWTTGRPLQEVDLSSIVTKALGSAFLSLSPLQITALSVASGRLWVGTGSGAVFSVPLSLSSESCSIPYCSLASAQLCYHGHRQAVKFIISAPGCRSSSNSPDGATTTSQLILSGGEGYINFRIGDDGSDGASESVLQRSERSHMIIWQSPTPSVPSPAL
ncbi:C-Jun-amino-terminal kinase-interacting protein 4-like isoform X2 [Cyprinus carpio]|uniref:C-Jun-amino-terminal kinase-interacting protein 4-like isoform X2 n=1 Tax=Cyprinus carpio TaxID=7962 RepID=A0A9Q9YXH7_CYPCA|nr:C-Jun-amino-terminal kinase-interacting protein 4-like isoform X2 [Cyprinus carpio]